MVSISFFNNQISKNIDFEPVCVLLIANIYKHVLYNVFKMVYGIFSWGTIYELLSWAKLLATHHTRRVIGDKSRFQSWDYMYILYVQTAYIRIYTSPVPAEINCMRRITFEMFKWNKFY